MTCIALIVASGIASRFSHTLPKQYAMLNQKPLLCHSLELLLEHPDVDAVKVMIHPNHISYYEKASAPYLSDKLLPFSLGGMKRKDTVRFGLNSIEHLNPQKVLIHDAARPLLSEALVAQLVQYLEYHQAVTPVMKIHDTIKLAKDMGVLKTVNRDYLYAAQTPQAFDYGLIHQLHQTLDFDDLTDDSMLCERAHIYVKAIDGERTNIKVTTEDDLALAQFYLAQVKAKQGELLPE